MSPWLLVRGPLDRVVAILLGIVAAPVVLVLGFVVRRNDPGPGIVKLLRVGRRGRLFRAWKLRTMRAELAGGLAAGSRVSLVPDERVTHVGRWLRRTHLDELPQLWNVARGEMLLLGPRTETPALVDLGDVRCRPVLRAAPGLTGPARFVVGGWRNATPPGDDPEADYRTRVLPTKLAVDAWYVRHASPWVDLLIVVSLVKRALLPRRTTPIERRVRRDLPAVLIPGRTLASAA